MSRFNAALACDDELGFVDLMDEDVEIDEEASLSLDDCEMLFEDEPEPMPELGHASPRRLKLVRNELAEAQVSLPLIVHRAALNGRACDAVQAFLRRQLPKDCGQEAEAAAVILWARHELYLFASQPMERRDRSTLDQARKALGQHVPQEAAMLKAWRTALRMISES
mgnify:CR=1 FL=1